jgi:ferredoxin
MGFFVLPKQDLSKFIEEVASEYKVFGPVDNNGVTLFEEVKGLSEINLGFSNSKMPPKALLFKQTETLFGFKLGEKPQVKSIDISDGNMVVFGIRPCDARSFAILDHVFKNDYQDPYYLKRRGDMVLVGLGCTTPDVNCFCTSFDGGPCSAEHVDALFTELGDRYLVEVKSEKGKRLSKKGLFQPASEEDKRAKREVEKKACNAIVRHLDTADVVDRLNKVFEHSFWKDIALKCLGCGICTFLCPTCHCFDIQDETTVSEGARVRIWDSCMRPEYTLQASGYNPRPLRMNRVRNRVYHKFNYFPKNFDVIACVGCGRCIDNCPVNTDILDIVTGVKEVLHEK